VKWEGAAKRGGSGCSSEDAGEQHNPRGAKGPWARGACELREGLCVVPCRGLIDARKVVCVPENAGEGSSKLFVAGPYAEAAIKGLWRSGRLLPGWRIIDFKGMLRALREKGYEGFLSVELFSKQLPTLGLAAAQKARSALTHVLAEL